VIVNGWLWRCAVDAERPRTRKMTVREKKKREFHVRGEEGFKLVQDPILGIQTQIKWSKRGRFQTLLPMPAATEGMARANRSTRAS
jgi:hypothetical protein